MGYGGSRADAAQAIGKSGDEGLDGIIKEDRLGLNIIYVQAKRWGRPWAVRRFKNSLAHYTGSTRLKGFSSQRRIFPDFERHWKEGFPPIPAPSRGISRREEKGSV